MLGSPPDGFADVVAQKQQWMRIYTRTVFCIYPADRSHDDSFMKNSRPTIAASQMDAVFGADAPRVSFEFFPPATEEMERRLWQTVTQLAPLTPDFVSVTYGAGGSTRERTHNTVTRIARETALKPAAHLTCVAASREEVDATAQAYWDAGIRHIVALRGDPPTEAGNYQPHPTGYVYASDLVAGLKRIADFDVSVAAFPEGHPENGSIELDLDNLQRKIDAGASRAITQYFFDTELFLRYRDKAAARGITIPIVPGLLPVTNYLQVIRFSALCGASVPPWLTGLFAGLEHDLVTRQQVASAVAVEQCRQLRSEGVELFHFYTLNRAELTLAICHVLGLRAKGGVSV